MNAPFEYSSLWNKSVLFINRALDPDIDFEERAAWAANALELLGKAALAKHHPSLIADPVKGDGTSLLMTAGIGEDYEKFVSIAAATVYVRCTKIAPKFNSAEARRIAGNRNAYLHAGGPLCSKITPEAWWRDYWPLVNVLLAAQERTLVEFVGSDNVVAIEDLITKSEEHTLAVVTARIESARGLAARRSADSLTATQIGEIRRRAIAVRMGYAENMTCPACGKTGEVYGEDEISEDRSEGGVDDGEWFSAETRYEIRADSFSCENCGLVLLGPEELSAADLLDVFEVVVVDDDFDFEPEYGND